VNPTTGTSLVVDGGSRGLPGALLPAGRQRRTLVVGFVSSLWLVGEPGGGVVEVEAAGAVEGFFGGADWVACG
jgi:hypothetical protein